MTAASVTCWVRHFPILQVTEDGDLHYHCYENLKSHPGMWFGVHTECITSFFQVLMCNESEIVGMSSDCLKGGDLWLNFFTYAKII
jgi:hypothetical protein